MSEAISTHAKTEVSHVSTKRVLCSGPVFSKHPKVFLTMGDDAEGNPDHVVCPYCSHTFVYVGGGEGGH